MNRTELARELRNCCDYLRYVAPDRVDGDVSIPKEQSAALQSALLLAAAALEEEDRDARRWRRFCESYPSTNVFRCEGSIWGPRIVVGNPIFQSGEWHGTIHEAFDAWLEEQEKEDRECGA